MNIGVKHDFPLVNIRKGGIENRGRMTKSRFIAIIAQIQRKTAKTEKMVAHFILQPYHGLLTRTGR